MLFAVVSSAMAFQPAARSTPVTAQRQVIMQFRAPGSTDTAAEEQRARTEASGQTPKEYEESTRRAANDYLASNGPHVGGPGDGPVIVKLFLLSYQKYNCTGVVPDLRDCNDERGGRLLPLHDAVRPRESCHTRGML